MQEYKFELHIIKKMPRKMKRFEVNQTVYGVEVNII